MRQNTGTQLNAIERFADLMHCHPDSDEPQGVSPGSEVQVTGANALRLILSTGHADLASNRVMLLKPASTALSRPNNFKSY